MATLKPQPIRDVVRDYIEGQPDPDVTDQSARRLEPSGPMQVVGFNEGRFGSADQSPSTTAFGRERSLNLLGISGTASFIESLEPMATPSQCLTVVS